MQRNGWDIYKFLCWSSHIFDEEEPLIGLVCESEAIDAVAPALY